MVSAEGIAEGINSQDGLSWQCLKNTVLSEGVCAEGINSTPSALTTLGIIGPCIRDLPLDFQSTT